jgi:NAD(P)-dependent dehydrogenase (short-subunit alcohol dehydrogenase family)
MDDKLLVLVTGANQGLGYHVVQLLATTGKHHVLLGSRDVAKAELAIAKLSEQDNIHMTNVSPIQIDMNSDKSISTAAEAVNQKYGRLDILMLNAGIVSATGSTREQYTRLYDTNVFGSVVTLDAFLPLLRKSTAPGGKRIAFTSSSFGSIQLSMEVDAMNPKTFPAINVYRSSKTAINMIMCTYAKLLEDDGFTVAASDPGYCATEMNGYSGNKDPRDGARIIVHTVTGDKAAVHGKLINEDGVEPW